LSNDGGKVQWNDDTKGQLLPEKISNSEIPCDLHDEISQCNDQVIAFDPSTASLVDDSQYPKDYLLQRAAWLAQADVQSSLPELPRSSVSALPKGDTSLMCWHNPVFSDLQASAIQPFIQSSIMEACKKFEGVSLNRQSQTQVVLPFPVSGTKNTVWLWGDWDAGDDKCSGSRAISVDVCNTMLSTALNGCDTDTTDFKYGGAKTNDCVVWGVTIDGPPRVRVTAQSPVGEAGSPFSCNLS
jgi:hypothetical protein